jgi:hypothetical protein
MMHFWRRREGPLTMNEHTDPTWAILDDGKLVLYHAAGADRAETERLLRRGLWHWDYLGRGVIRHAGESA